MLNVVRPWAVVSAFLVTSLATCSGQVLYDGSLGLPTSQGWTFLALGGSQTASNSGALLDTSTSSSIQAGYTHATPVPLNRTNGFTLLFTSQMISEAHLNANRAGFSVIALSDDKHGIELAFWTNTIFAQADSPLFTHAEETNYPTTAAVAFALTFHPANYVLTANGVPILTGAVRDYTAFSGGIFNPYSTPNFIFFGDDTTSAGGAVNLKKVVLITAPKLVAASNRQVAWTGVTNQTYTVQSSSNMVNWTSVGSATSATANFVFTNQSAASPLFFRVSYP